MFKMNKKIKGSKNLNVPNKGEQSQTCLGSAERKEQSPQGNVPNKRAQSQVYLNYAEHEEHLHKENVPNLRFPEFSGEWEKTTIGKCCGNLEYGMNAAAKTFDGVNKYIRITDIDEDTSSYIQSDIVSPDARLEEKYRVTLNDILFARTGASTGKTYLYRPDDGKLYFAGFLIRANVKENYNSRFVFLQTKTSSYKRWVAIMSTRSGQPGINSQEYSSYSFKAPTLKEQNKIADIFRLLDERIATQIKIIEDLKKLKSAITHSHFNFALSKFQSHIIGRCITQVSNRNKDGRVTQVLSVSNKSGFINQSEQFEDREIASEDTTNYKIVRTNDFAYNPARINVGSIARLHTFSSGIVSPMYVCFHTKPILSAEYFEHFFYTTHFKHEMYKRLEGSVRLCLTYESLCNIKIALPAIEEQETFVQQISAIVSKIDNEEKILIMYQSQKQYLLAQMFI